ncbi:MAG: peptide chain release factor 1 [Candidatus Absconditabacteria bacterium]
MFDKLEELAIKYEKLKEDFYDPDISCNPKKAIEISKQLSSLEDVYDLYIEYKNYKSQIAEAKDIIFHESDEEIKEMAKMQLEEGELKLEEIQTNLKIALLPKDPNDDKNIFLEIRPAAGGDEAGLFASQLMRMYLRYAEQYGYKAEIIEHETSGIGGLKIAVIKISGDKAYSKFKFESGVHRVQRIPETESQGRVHTSTVTVAVMPEIDDVEVDVKREDIDLDTFAASSAGGQHANKNETGVRLTHLPTGIVVCGTDSRSQLQNKEKAFKVLKAKVYQIELEKQQKEQKDVRLDQIGSGDRSEKIRTYNFPQDRITDHRIKQSWSNLPGIMEGNIDEIMNSLMIENQAKLLTAQSEKL